MASFFWWCLRLFQLRFSCDIGVKLPKSTILRHPVGIVVGSGVRVGESCMIYQNVTLGVRDNGGAPVIGDRVEIGAGAMVLGEVKVGDGAVIGAGAIVLGDVPAGGCVKGVWKGV